MAASSPTRQRGPSVASRAGLAYATSVRKLVGLLLFLVFADDYECAYGTHFKALMAWVNPLIEPTIIKVRPFDLILCFILLAASFDKKNRAPYLKPMRNALLVTLTTTVLWFVYGVVRGGDARMASWQTYLILSTILLSFTVAATFRTSADFAGLAKWFIAAALYRALMCWIAYFSWGSVILGESGAFLTAHGDTITWVVAIVILIANALDRRKWSVTLRNSAGIVFFLGAIQWNSRRVAWVSLAMALAVMYWLLPRGAAKRAVVRLVRVAGPVIVLYVVVGWGRQNPIFLPLRALASVTTQEDSSTKARNAENLGLIGTSKYSSILTGTGWGFGYAPISMKYSIAWIELWKYEPHNSILGLLAFTGILGFAGIWLPVPTAVFLNARVARLGTDPRTRNVALVGVAQLIVSANQFYGDIGIFSNQAMYVMAITYAMALRLPIRAGVWGGSAPVAPPRGG
jgi:O-antigen ligase/polysaccharide polymerase Wzy-like membrane protein